MLPRAAFAPARGFRGTFVNRPERRSSWPATRMSHRHVTEARYLGDYKVWLEFNDGRKGVVDLADELYGENSSRCATRDRFADFYLDYGLASIAWHDGVDFAPDFLYEQAEARCTRRFACPRAALSSMREHVERDEHAEPSKTSSAHAPLLTSTTTRARPARRAAPRTPETSAPRP